MIITDDVCIYDRMNDPLPHRKEGRKETKKGTRRKEVAALAAGIEVIIKAEGKSTKKGLCCWPVLEWIVSSKQHV